MATEPWSVNRSVTVERTQYQVMRDCGYWHGALQCSDPFCSTWTSRCTVGVDADFRVRKYKTKFTLILLVSTCGKRLDNIKEILFWILDVINMSEFKVFTHFAPFQQPQNAGNYIKKLVGFGEKPLQSRQVAEWLAWLWQLWDTLLNTWCPPKV